MELKEKLLSSFIAFENQDSSDSLFLNELRGEAIKNFETSGFPSKKDEAWKYTSLRSVLKQDYSLFPKSEHSIEYRDVQSFFVDDIGLISTSASIASRVVPATSDTIARSSP